MEECFNLNTYWFDLPEDRIAQFPPKDQSLSRLLIVPGKEEGAYRDGIFADIGDFLPDNALLIANDSRVFPGRIFFRNKSGAKIEFLMLTPLQIICENHLLEHDFKSAQIECLFKPASKIRIGDYFELAPNLWGKVSAKGEFGKHEVLLQWKGDLENIFQKYGNIPLPPYIKREALPDDREAYQTCYGSKTGSVAAPTAGLHFTNEIRKKLENKGFQWENITLHVGYGTFNPVRCSDIRNHKMHAEYIEIPEKTAVAINSAIKNGRAVIAIGTTTLRCLEGVWEKTGGINPYKGMIDNFIYEGYKFKVVDGLLTNFHLPESSLLILVCAFAGRKKIMNAYEYAKAKGYNFFSYGDSMLITVKK